MNARPLSRCCPPSLNSRESVFGAIARRSVRNNRDRFHGVSERICEACDWHCRATRKTVLGRIENFLRLLFIKCPVATVRLLFGGHPRRRRTLRASAWRDNQKFVWRLLLSLRLVFSWRLPSARFAIALSAFFVSCESPGIPCGAKSFDTARTGMILHFAVARMIACEASLARHR